MRMGMIPVRKLHELISSRAPHAYGDDPNGSASRASMFAVLPMRMGMIPRRPPARIAGLCAPHAYGDDPGDMEVWGQIE